jgi:hypothetical protein
MYLNRQNWLLCSSNRVEFILGKMKAKKSYHTVEFSTNGGSCKGLLSFLIRFTVDLGKYLHTHKGKF